MTSTAWLERSIHSIELFAIEGFRRLDLILVQQPLAAFCNKILQRRQVSLEMLKGGGGILILDLRAKTNFLF